MRLTEEQYADLMLKRQVDRATASPEAWNAHLAKVMRTADGMAPKQSKYRNVKTTDAAGNVHDSGKEYQRWCELQLRERAGEISNLRRQVSFALAFDGELICRYVADFVYSEGAAVIVEDCKSPATRKLEAYRLKVKMMSAIHKLQIREV